MAKWQVRDWSTRVCLRKLSFRKFYNWLVSNPRGGGLLAPVENTSTSERLACALPPSNKITRKKLHKVELIIITFQGVVE